ncbi:murein L,D-transpeptidase [Rhodobacteraceae bacterium WD3A24]|nr:murein L,D-transpeptidase [Rhodobacteraceae bacterium WD3A24]
MTGIGSKRLVRGRAGLLVALVIALATLLAQTAAAQQFTAFRQALAEGAASSEALSTFYRDRDYQALWTGADDAERRAALFTALSRARQHGLPEGRYDAAGLISSFRSIDSERDRGLLEARVSRTFLQYARDIHSGVLEPREVDSNMVRDPRRRDPLALITEFSEAEPMAYLRGLVPQTSEYARLFRARQDLARVVAEGGWGPRVNAGRLDPGQSGPAVVELRNRLIAMGYMGRSPSRAYDTEMEIAVRRFQEAHGLETDGVAGPDTIAAINTPATARLRSLVVAMERERWMNFDRGARHVWVNMVDFVARIIDEEDVTFETKAIIGHQSRDRQTPEFSDVMEYMEINPDWTIPRSIVGAEYLPGLRADPYAHGHLQVIDASGQVVPRGSVDFSRYSARTLPFNLRQPPGPTNPLGRVKFMFPNPHAIYLHDTPTQYLFSNSVRTFSHGCIRLDDPYEFAYELLSPQADDPQQVFHSILNSRVQTRVELENPVPVHLVYRTAYTTSRGEMQFRDDVYGRDARVYEALGRAGVVTPGLQS